MMIKEIFIMVILFVVNINPVFSQGIKDVVFSTEYAYEIPDYLGHSYTPIMTLCQDKDSGMYYQMSNVADSCEEYIIMWTGNIDETRAVYDSLASIIKNIEYNCMEKIKDAKGSVFIISSPLIEDHLGRYVRMQQENKDNWGIISKQHLKNFRRVF